MPITNARNMLNLHGFEKIKYIKSIIKTLLILFIINICSITPSVAQYGGKGNYNYMDFQKRNYYFGISLAYNKSDYRIFRSKAFLPTSGSGDTISALNASRGPGFNLQIISNLKIGEDFDIRFLPGFSFAERTVEFSPTRRKAFAIPKTIESVFVELPFHVRYKSAPYYDKRLFVMSGIKYAFDIQSKSRARIINNNLKISPTDFQVEFGAGMQMFFPYFIFSPEIKFSHGLGNILIYQNASPESKLIEKLMSRTFTISFHFEG
jgi:hypothetical protein